MASRRAGPKEELEPLCDGIDACANAIASYAAVDEFVKEQAETREEIPEETFGLTLNDKEACDEETISSSSDGIEVTASAAAEPKAPKDARPGAPGTVHPETDSLAA